MLMLGRKIRPWVDKFSVTELRQERDVRMRWKYRNQLVAQFWNAWLKYYTIDLQQRRKWYTINPNLEIGELVLVHRENIKRHNWPLGRIVNIRKGRDGMVRSLIIRIGEKKLADGNIVPAHEITRSVQNVYPLEIAHGNEID